MTVALIERQLFGGTCVNTGCTPTKTMVASAYAAHLARRGADFGVAGGPVSVDMTRVRARADAVVSESRDGIEAWLREMAGCTVIQGHARFEAPDVISVGDSSCARHASSSTSGAAPASADAGRRSRAYLDNSSHAGARIVPAHLVVVGGSYVGLEFAQMYRRFGAEVTVVEMKPRLIANEDDEVSEAIREILEGEGIAVHTGAECIALAPHAAGVAVADCSEVAPEVVGSDVLLAVGRAPEHRGPRPGPRRRGHRRARLHPGRRRLATTVPGIWALGDCNGRGAFTHTAYNDFEIVAANLLDGERRKVGDRIPGYALYIDPPLGRVGLTERRRARAADTR